MTELIPELEKCSGGNMQILPGTYLINGSPYGRHQNGYLVQTGGATILIDSGDLEDAACLPEVGRNAARWGFRLEQASHLFVTHSHFDHASHAAALQRRGIKVVASPVTARSMAAADEMCIGFAVHRAFEACRADVIVQDGEEIAIGGLKVRCLAAPGHTEGLVVYEIVLDGQRCWFVGDLLITLHAHQGVELPWTGSPDFDRARYIETLAKLVKQPCDHLFPGHGPAAIGCGKRVIEMAYTQALIQWR
jgi:glyoxylase-like metal-dependent hydrolase (beta-lactamase superfamily II)